MTGEVRRFLTSPRGCRAFGLAFTPDGRYCIREHSASGVGFENDPGRRPWPSGIAEDRPRSATVVITGTMVWRDRAETQALVRRLNTFWPGGP